MIYVKSTFYISEL